MKAIRSPALQLVLPFEQVGLEAISLVGGKNASLGEMIRELSNQGIKVPSGFATTAHAYRVLLDSAHLSQGLHDCLDGRDAEQLPALQQAGAAARDLLLKAPLPIELEEQLLLHY
ncbi:MAG: PEP/pyruvate-binding domain-containing protein, partial [Vulcanococcus sp.]